jgi:RimJ/RimL family protein N-acetyltransferase
MRVLEGGVVRLEPQLEAHADALFELLLDPALYAHENEPPASLQWLRERFRRLESRESADGAEQWLNWAVFALPATPVGYVQATVYPTGRADIAYVFGSRFWGRGLATAAVELMVAELQARYGVKTLTAALKRTNAPSLRLLERLGFEHAPEAQRAGIGVAPDELLLVR